MRQKRGLFSRFCERLDVPREALPFGFGLSMSGQNELTVRGCQRILQYGEREIRLSLGKTVMTILGEHLLFTVFSACSITVSGQISRISFEGKSYEN
jgi:sporulation protein YqfC